MQESEFLMTQLPLFIGGQASRLESDSYWRWHVWLSVPVRTSNVDYEGQGKGIQAAICGLRWQQTKTDCGSNQL